MRDFVGKNVKNNNSVQLHKDEVALEDKMSEIEEASMSVIQVLEKKMMEIDFEHEKIQKGSQLITQITQLEN
jgi:hypothetical protein